MKKLLNSLFVLAVLAFALPAQAQLQPYYLRNATISSNGTVVNAIAETATNTTVKSDTLFSRGALHIAIQPEFKLTDTGTSAVILRFQNSVDGSSWTTGDAISVTANGTNAVSKATNIQLNAIGYIRLSSVENPNANPVTNLVIKYATKSP